MNRFLTAITLLIVLNVAAFCREIIFDLHKQDFMNSLSDRQLSTKYNVEDKVIVQTNLLKDEQGVYHTNSDIMGKFDIYTNTPLIDWKFNLDVQYEGLKTKNRFIKFTDTNGEVILLEFNTVGFVFNSIDYNANINKKHLFIQVKRIDGKIEFYLNKQLIDSQNLDFARLKSIETTFYKFNVYEQDKLNNVMLVSND